jgi:hypothetical protein
LVIAAGVGVIAATTGAKEWKHGSSPAVNIKIWTLFLIMTKKIRTGGAMRGEDCRISGEILVKRNPCLARHSSTQFTFASGILTKFLYDQGYRI